MSKVKAVLDFAEAYDATNPDKQAEHAALEAEVNLLSEQDEWEGHAIHGAVIAAIYAGHVTAELRAENAALRAKVAELEEQLDNLNNSYATCGNPDCTPTQVCELFFNGCMS